MSEETSENVISFENVKFSYPGAQGVYALNGVSLTVRRGEFLSVIGHNGSGKSTLARLVNGLLTAESGKVCVFGYNLTEDKPESEDSVSGQNNGSVLVKSARDVRTHVGVVFQNPDNQTVASIVEDDVAFGPENIGIKREEIGKRIDWALKAVGMEEYRHATPARLSGGQKQRIAVAGVLAIKPEIIILDESTAMLDPKGRREVMEVVRNLNKREHMTVILITHFMEEALLADRTVVMNRGEIVLSGTPEEIFESGDKLEAYNLCLPRISGIIGALNAAGMDIKPMLRSDELAEEISRKLPDGASFSAFSDEDNTDEAETPHDWDIDIKNLTFTYSKKSPFATKALKGVNLHIGEGEFFGIIGHTGSGKSTLVQHLNALIKLPQAGKRYRKKRVKKGSPAPELPEITVGQFDLSSKKCDFKSLRASVGMVFQYPEYQLFAETVFADVAFGLKNFNKNLGKEEIEKAVRDSLEMVGLDYNEVKDKSPFDLSGGQKRRVAIAGVIVTRPGILILDEPAAGLDPLGKKEIMELLHKLHREWCKTVIIVSHDMDEVAENCTRAAVIADGEVVMCDKPDRLFAKHDRLISLGLDVPLTVKICRGLEKYGIRIEGVCEPEKFASVIAGIYGGKSNA